MLRSALPSVSIDLARILIRYAADNGWPEEALWRLCGLDPLQRQVGGVRIPAQRFDALWRAVEGNTGDGLFGLGLGRAVKDYAGGHLLYAVLLNSPTVRAALAKFCRYHSILSDVVQPRLVPSTSTPAIRLDPPLQQMHLSLSQEAFILSLFASIFQNLTGSAGNIREVRFSNAAPNEISAYQCAFGCPLMFQCRESALFPLQPIMDQPVFLADPDLLAGLESMAFKLIGQLSTDNSMRQKTAQAIGRMLTRGDKPSIEAVAKRLAMSIRRLQQKLKSEQTGYREILDQVRKETALRLLQDDKNSIAEITFILGFSEQSGFTHAFQAWAGTTPGKYRKARKNLT